MDLIKLDADHICKLLKIGLEPADPLLEHAEKTWPARNGHKAGCCGYYDLNECECQRTDWKPLSSGNYPRNPNPPMREPDPRDRL